VPAGDSGALALALGELLDDPAARQALAEGAASAAAGAYSWDVIGARTAELYRRLVSGPGGPG
jgi:glycosyltransferase involved in cell wall biosynthesis